MRWYFFLIERKYGRDACSDVETVQVYAPRCRLIMGGWSRTVMHEHTVSPLSTFYAWLARAHAEDLVPSRGLKGARARVHVHSALRLLRYELKRQSFSMVICA